MVQFRDLTPTPWDFAFELEAWLGSDGSLPLLDRLGVALCLQDMHGRSAAVEPGYAPVGSHTDEQVGAHVNERRTRISLCARAERRQ